jgi:hypothetical protein
MADTEQPAALITGLRAWAATHDANVRAAVELLIWHGYWLRRADFRAQCVGTDPHEGLLWIKWRELAGYADSGLVCSSSEMTILRLVIAIGGDDLRLMQLGAAHRKAVVKAFADALRVRFDA